jgi:hypothetical protein
MEKRVDWSACARCSSSGPAVEGLIMASFLDANVPACPNIASKEHVLDDDDLSCFLSIMPERSTGTSIFCSPCACCYQALQLILECSWLEAILSYVFLS